MSLAEKKEWNKVDEKINEKKNFYLTKKDINIPFEVDQASFKGQEPIADITFYAGMIFEGIANVVTQGDDEKQAVLDGIKTIKFGHGATSFSLDNGCFMANFELNKADNPSTVRDKAYDWLMNNLG